MNSSYYLTNCTLPDLLFFLYFLWKHHKIIKSNNVIKVIPTIPPATAPMITPVLSSSLLLNSGKSG